MSKKNSFNFNVIVNENEIDNLNHVNNIHYIQWVQKAAQKHWKILSTATIEIKYIWVVLRHEIDYISSAVLNDKLTVTTWIGASYGVKSERFVEIRKGTKLISKVKTIWCLLDKNTMKPTRIPPEILKILQIEIT